MREEASISLKLQVLNHHLFGFLPDGSKWLLDTGSPNSFGGRSQISLLGNTFNIPSNFLHLDRQKLSEHVKEPCDGLLGMDVLKNYIHIFDVANEQWILTTTPLQSSQEEQIPLQLIMSVPLLEVKVNQQTYRAFFDTGAQLSYLPSDVLSSFPQVGIREDFFPIMGTFSTPVHQVEVSIGQRSYPLRVGKLPFLLQTTLSLTGAKGVIGSELCIQRKVTFDPLHQTLCIH